MNTEEKKQSRLTKKQKRNIIIVIIVLVVMVLADFVGLIPISRSKSCQRILITYLRASRAVR